MKMMTSTKPTASAMAPARIASAPSSGPTLRSSTTVSGAGSAPARSSTARSVALAAVKLPLIWPRPPVIASRITGALITLSSSTMAKRLPTLRLLTSAKRRVPTESKVKFTTHSPVCGFWPALASVRLAPSTSTRRRTAILPPPGPSWTRKSVPGGGTAGGGVGVLVHQPEGHPRGLAQQFLDPVRILDARQLHHDAVIALAGDGGIDHARAVDAAAHDLDGLLHRQRWRARSAPPATASPGSGPGWWSRNRGRSTLVRPGGVLRGQLLQRRQRRALFAWDRAASPPAGSAPHRG